MRRRPPVPTVAGPVIAGLVVAALVVAGLAFAAVGAPAGASHDGTAADSCPAGMVPEDGFGDVPGANVHETAVDCLAWWGISGGVTWASYRPGDTVDRAQMATFVARYMEQAGATLPADPPDAFDDDVGSVHEPRIDQLAALGVVEGTGPRTFAPGQPVTRGQAASLLVRSHEEATGEALPDGGDRFDDDDASVHEPSLDRAAEAGWLRGVTPRRVEPDAPLQRDAMASLLVRALDTLVEDGRVTPPASFATGPAPDLDLQLVTDAVVDPILVTAPPGDDRLFVVERAGRVVVLDGGAPTTWLDIRPEVSTSSERGLLGIAFPPAWPTDGRVFVSWTDTSGASRLAEFSATPAGADPRSRHTIDVVAQPAANHNGGMVTFGPDGLLWWSLGDGGGADDTFGNGQDPSTPLGGINRYEVTGQRRARPPGNVFAEESLWAMGLRNPWRFSFDAATGHVYIADVGQGSWEEVDVVPGRRTGANFGWPVMEGDHCVRSGCDPARYVPPVYEYPNGTGGCSITGGVVYRGTDIPALQGHYLLSDYCAGFLRTLRFDGQQVHDVRDHAAPAARLPGGTKQVVSFGTDAGGEVYLVSFSGVYRVVAAG